MAVNWAISYPRNLRDRTLVQARTDSGRKLLIVGFGIEVALAEPPKHLPGARQAGALDVP
jgi:hypothetical protein